MDGIKALFILIMIVVVAVIIVGVTSYHFAIGSRGAVKTTIEPTYTSIEVYFNGELVKKLTLEDLHKLKDYAFVDSMGHRQYGPRLHDVIKYVLGNTHTYRYVVVKGVRGNPETNLTSTIVDDPKNYIILDFTRKGTVKLCGDENVLPYDRWVKDVVEISIGG